MESGLDLWPWALVAVVAGVMLGAALAWRARLRRGHMPRITAAINANSLPGELEIDIVIENVFNRPIRIEGVQVVQPQGTLITDKQEWVTTPQGRAHRPRFVTDRIASTTIVPAPEPGFDGALRQAIWARPPADWKRQEIILAFAVTLTDPVSHTASLRVPVGLPETWAR